MAAVSTCLTMPTLYPAPTSLSARNMEHALAQSDRWRTLAKGCGQDSDTRKRHAPACVHSQAMHRDTRGHEVVVLVRIDSQNSCRDHSV